MATTFYLVRHGQSVGNVDPAAARGALDAGELGTGLTELGRRQARELAERLRHVTVDAIFASDLRRAQQTAELLAEGRGTPIVTSDVLREIAAERVGEGADHLLAWLEPLAARHPNGTLLVVTHGGVLRCLLVHLGWAPLDALPQNSIGNTGYVVLQHDGAGFTVREVADLSRADRGGRAR